MNNLENTFKQNNKLTWNELRELRRLSANPDKLNKFSKDILKQFKNDLLIEEKSYEKKSKNIQSIKWVSWMTETIINKIDNLLNEKHKTSNTSKSNEAIHKKVKSIENNSDIITTISENFDKFNFKYLQISDILALVKLESNFNPKAQSSTGSIWLFQTTSIVIKDMIKHPNKYNQKIIKIMLDRNGLKSLSQMEKRYIRKDLQNSMDIWMLYLKRLENYKNKLYSYQKDIIKNNKKNIFKKISHLLLNKWIHIDDSNFNIMFNKILNNPDVQRKFCILRNYNWDKKAYSWEKLQHRYYYAFTTLYMSKYVISK